MSSLWNRHPDHKLVPYLDGELSPRAARRVEQHLESCGPCRQELEELRETLADCVAYTRQAALPEPPLPWRDLYRDFSRIDESLANEPLLVRLARPLVHAGAPRWAMAAAMAMLVVTGVFYQLRHAPSVQAASLLKRAIAIADAKPRPAHRVRFHTSKQDFIRVVGSQAPAAEAAVAPGIRTRFEQAHYSWIDPLSAFSFQQWRDSLPSKTDQISTITQSTGELHEIRTTAAEGEIADVTLTLGPDLTPTAERIEFRDQEWVELTDISESLTENSGTTAVRSAEVPVRAAEPPSRPAAFTPGPPASISDELQVMSALHDIEADLGDTVYVSLATDKVLVTGTGLTSARQQQIQSKLKDLPRVEVQFAEPQAVAALSSPVSTTETAGGTPIPAIQSRVEKQVGGRAQFERFSSQALDLADAAMARVYAIHSLAQKFPVESESQLSGKDRELLLKLSREHAVVLSQKVSALDNLLLPMLTSLGGTTAQVHAVPHTAWQPAAEDVFRASKRVDKLVSAVLGSTPSDVSAAKLPSELLAALKDLQSELADCHRLLGQ